MAAPTVPTGRSGFQAIADVRSYSNEPTLPADSVVLNFLNLGLQEVERRVGGIRLLGFYPTVANQNVVQLNNDVQDVISANFSMGNANANNTGSASPFAQGALVYPMFALSEGAFMDAAAGFPAVGFGPPQAYLIYQDSGLAPSTPLSPPATPTLSIVSTGSLILVWNVSNWNQSYWGPAAVIGKVEVVITYTNPAGETTPSPPADVTLITGQAAQVQSPDGVANATGYNVYAGNVGGPYSLQNSTPIALGTAFTIPPPFSTGGVNPPTSNTTGGLSGGGSLFMQLYPAAMIGQVNIYYRARPLLWADNTTSSYTNLDTSLQEAAIIFAVGRVLMYRERAEEWIKVWKPEYESLVTDMRESAQRRTVPKSGQVRDVSNRSFPSSPWWIG
jgi:hypothetical protein